MSDLKKELQKKNFALQSHNSPRPRSHRPHLDLLASGSRKFTPFKGSGSGTMAKSPLLMHSRMMEIHSTLASPSTLARSVASYENHAPSYCVVMIEDVNYVGRHLSSMSALCVRPRPFRYQVQARAVSSGWKREKAVSKTPCLN
ncbi:hypothetical protein K431DRAFT_283208 [Polychaeton citri CBS 116435]|uniref:Uncharacterized protein n=1 Tax=Polychaeton citri CBS 116435 TaxID=1314669 RepID=A0A9P4URW7_9PEZI|nr:hypothetical protein K431DRAFT_283208 [Polychaeton citri CBS 116435]